MRFLIGLILGAGLIFAVVGVLGSGTPDRLADWADGIALRLGDWLSLPPRQEAPEGDLVQRLLVPGMTSVVSADGGGAVRDGGSEIDPRDLPAAREPIPRPPDPRPLDDVAAEAAAAVSADDPTSAPSGSRDEDVQSLVAEIFGPRRAAPRAGARGDAPPVAATGQFTGDRSVDAGDRVARGTGSQPVWVPFHSQMSAAGFAARLGESLGRPFDVERQGPGRYQVVFAYADESERAAVLEEAAAVTGLPL